MRVGFGFDAHPLVEGKPLVLCGVCVPHTKGLEGYSDGDAGTHAVIDAVLGAAALGDCGTHFPAGNPEFANAASLGLLRRAGALLGEAGYYVANVDCTLVAEAPKLSPHIEGMRSALANALGVAVSAVSVKAKRTEGLGFTGKQRGIAAYAVAFVLPRPEHGSL